MDKYEIRQQLERTSFSGIGGSTTPQQLLDWPQQSWGGYESNDSAAAASNSDTSKDSKLQVATLSFDAYAACRLLDTTPDEAVELGAMFEALRTVAVFYFRADKGGICDTLQAYGVSDSLYNIACAKRAFLSGSEDQVTSSGSGCRGNAGRSSAGDGRTSSKKCHREEMAELMRKLLRQLECLLIEYFSYNWDRSDDVQRANEAILRDGGPTCDYYPDTSFSPATCSHGGSPGMGDDNNSISHQLRPGSAAIGGIGCRDKGGAHLHRELLAAPHRQHFRKEGAESRKLNSEGQQKCNGHPSARQYSDSSSNDCISANEMNATDEALHGGVSVDEYTTGADATLDEDRQNEGKKSNRQPRNESSNGRGGGSGSKSRAAHLKSFGSFGRFQKEDKARTRAVRNWQRARMAVAKKITTDMLGTQRKFQTMFDIFEDLKRHAGSTNHSSHSEKANSKRQPVCLFLGGGMAAGKSTVREIIGRDLFWSKVAKEAVVVEADAIKNKDVVYQQLSRSLGGSFSSLAAEVHEYSTAAAESMFVTAINHQQDVIFDGTMMWAPFVKQSIAMVRDHLHSYRRGPGYRKNEDGSVTEQYWEVDDCGDADARSRVAYRIEIVGVTCDTGLAVARGLWRQVRTKRGVPIKSQLRSHKLFSSHFDEIASLADSATLYHTGQDLTTFSKSERADPVVIAHRSDATRGEMLVNPVRYNSFCHKADINVEASSRDALYSKDGPCEQSVCRPETVEDLRPIMHAFRRAKTAKNLRCQNL